MPDSSSTILLVDDEDSIQALLTYPLERDGYRVVQARDGDEALRRFGEEPIDLVVLDIMLPKVDGLEVCRRLRGESTVPIIMLTARDDELEPEHLVELVVAGRQHDDGDGAVGTQAPADLEPVHARQHDVEDDEVDVLLREALERLVAVARLHDAISVPLERVGEQRLDRVLVVDEEDGRRGVRHGHSLRRGGALACPALL